MTNKPDNETYAGMTAEQFERTRHHMFHAYKCVDVAQQFRFFKDDKNDVEFYVKKAIKHLSKAAHHAGYKLVKLEGES